VEPDDREYFSAPGAEVENGAVVGAGTKIWGLASVRSGAVVGTNCILGRGCYVGPGARIGDNVKIQTYALVFEPAQVGDGVFIGPHVVLTNDLNPRAVTPDGRLKTNDDWDMVSVTIEEGAAIGARAVCVAPVTIGRWALVAAGAVVAADVPAFALVAGVPARRIGWVGRAGKKLVRKDNRYICPENGAEYVETDGILSESAT
jgi:UDP-2-acetamido-3-amino-2,3-dideoxy-glucuronate N-acetyltransferase